MSVVEKYYREFKGHFAIDIANWELLPEGVTVLWGPSGAGKSTILAGLLGLDRAAEVRWTFHGERLDQLPPAQRRLGVVFQDAALFTHMTVQENILFPVDEKKHPHWQEDFQFLTETLEITAILQSPTPLLSGGEKQRVAIARAMIYRPRMLLLDEPFSHLDATIRHKVRLMVKDVCARLKCPVLLVTHDRSDVHELAQKVTQIDRGKIVREGGVDSLQNH